jgi:hypothetical protein
MIFFESDEIRTLLFDLVEEQTFSEKSTKFEEFTRFFHEYLSSIDAGAEIKEEIEQNLGWLENCYSSDFVDTFCIYLLNRIDMNLPVWTELTDYILDNQKLKSSNRKINNIWKINFIEGGDYLEFRKVVFENIRGKSSVQGLRRFLDYYYQNGSGFAENLWNSLEIKLILEDAVRESSQRTVVKLVSDALRNVALRVPIQDPSFITNQLETFIATIESDKFQSINTVKSSRVFTPVKDFIRANIEDVQSGKLYLSKESFWYFGGFFENNETNTENLNNAYNRLNPEIEYILTQKIKLSNFGLDQNAFSLRDFEKTIWDISHRLSYEKIRHNLVEELWNSFDLSFSQYIANTCFDFLAISFYKLIQWRKLNLLSNFDNEFINTWSWVKFVDDFSKDTEVFFSKISDSEIFPEETFDPVAELRDLYSRIEGFKVTERIYDLANQKVREKVTVSFKENVDGDDEKEYLYTGPLPFRYYNLLTLDTFIFDSINFSFLERRLDFLSDNLLENTIDSILQNKFNALGFVTTIFFENKSPDLLLEELYLNHPQSVFNLNEGSLGFNMPSSQQENYFAYLLGRKHIADEIKNSIRAEFDGLTEEKIIIVDDGTEKLNLIRKIHNDYSGIVGNAPYLSQYYGHAANQASRLNTVELTDIGKIFSTSAQRQQIDAKNKYRQSMIDGFLWNYEQENDKCKDLLGFFPLDPYNVGVVIPSLTLLDFTNKRLITITTLNSASELRSWYFKYEFPVGKEFIEQVHRQMLIEHSFFDKFKIDLSGVCLSGPNYFLGLINYLENKNTLNEKFNNHCLDFYETIQIKNLVGQVKLGQSFIDRKIDNKAFEKAFILSNRLLEKERDFLAIFYGFPYKINPVNAAALNQFNLNRRNFVTQESQKLIQNFNATFEPKLKEWNSDFYAITIGSGGNDGGIYFILNINTGNINLTIPSPNIFGINNLSSLNLEVF